MTGPKFINFERFGEASGELVPFYVNKSFPKKFRLKRFFFLYGKKKYFRADHAHKKCTQIIIALNGQIKIYTFFKKKKKIFNINQKSKKALFVPPKCWLKIKFSKNLNSLITLCNYKYDKSEYILSFNEFKKKYY